MRSQRIEALEAYILQHKTVTLQALCQAFDVSISTLRRDLNALAAEGNVRKTYGGVVATPRGRLVSFVDRSIANPDAKQKIAMTAAAQVVDGDIIFIDSGTTTLHMAEGIQERQNLTVLTNNIEVILKMMPFDNINVISLSGVLNRKTFSFTGAESADVLKKYNVSKVFMACTGVSAESGVTNSSRSESGIKSAAVGRGQKVYLLADDRKFGVVSLITYCELAQLNALITNQAPPPALAAALENAGVQVLLAK